MDYFAIPHAPSYMIPAVAFVDIAAGVAAIPGSGDQEVVFTHTTDVARFVERCVSQEGAWPEKSTVVGDKVTFHQIVDVAERVRGKRMCLCFSPLIGFGNSIFPRREKTW